MKKYQRFSVKIIFLVFMAVIIFISAPLRKVEASGFGYKKNNKHEVPSIGKYQPILERNNAYYVGQGKNVYLTFDSGYDNGNMEKILSVLKDKNVAATFFVTGDFVTRFTPLLKNIIDDGHTVGNHSYLHRPIDTISSQEIVNDAAKLERLVEEKTAYQMPKLYRPPEGRFDERSLQALNKSGYKTFFWSVAFVDWNNKEVDSYHEVINNLHDGAIILLHSVSNSNTIQLARIIDEIRRVGYTFKPLTEI